MKNDPKVGEVVAFLWGVSEVVGTVVEVYGAKGRRQVVMARGDWCSTHGHRLERPTSPLAAFRIWPLQHR